MDDCNCKSCKDIKRALRIKDYNWYKNGPLTPDEFIMQFGTFKPETVASMLVNRFAVLCKDGLIRKR